MVVGMLFGPGTDGTVVLDAGGQSGSMVGGPRRPVRGTKGHVQTAVRWNPHSLARFGPVVTERDVIWKFRNLA